MDADDEDDDEDDDDDDEEEEEEEEEEEDNDCDDYHHDETLIGLPMTASITGSVHHTIILIMRLYVNAVTELMTIELICTVNLIVRFYLNTDTEFVTIELIQDQCITYPDMKLYISSITNPSAIEVLVLSLG
jgi:DMSO reductase anchor subunit